ncbi:SDR family oxidoreductase [Streptomyces sp. TS71-3]|uniref:SDR family oxidoreductase n=1 Tax=Streptomyces sp. TS71-3 TaxID=2733862 RepID=UPI001BB3AB7E|nr:NAD(P)H-binding protein [Streptomyces sp. TS71-3]
MIVVTGATGNIGRSLVDQLLAEGAPVRALTRDPAAAGLADAAETVRADLLDPSALGSVFGGATAVYLNLAAGGMGGIEEIVGAVVRSGARRIVLNSSYSVTIKGAEDTMIPRIHAEAERAVRDSGLEWTFVRGGYYATNTLRWAAAIKADGVVRGAYAEAVMAPVHEADLAAVTARALLDDAHVGTAPVLTGPAGLTQAEQVAVIGRVAGVAARYEEISPEEAVEAMATAHFPAEVARQLVDGMGELVGAEPDITGEVERVAGRPAKTFEEWATEHAAAFR